jgi:hypothetical protein
MNFPLFSPEMMNLIFFTLGLFVATAITFYMFSYKFKKTKIKKRLIVLGVGITGLMLLYILFYTICSATGRSAVEKLLAEMAELKSPATVSEPELKPSNGLEYYQAANALMAPSNHIKEFHKIQLNKKSYDVYDWNKTDQESAKRVMSSKLVYQMIDLMHLGAQEKVEPYPGNFTLDIDYFRLLRELRMRRELYRHLYMKSGTLGLEDKPEAGYTVLLDGLLAAKQFEFESTAIGQMVNIACIAIDMKGINLLLEHYGIDNKPAIKLMAALQQLDATSGIVRGLNGEILIIKEAYQRPGLSETHQKILDKISGTTNLLERSVRNIVAGPFRYWDFYYYIKNINQIQLLLSKPYWEITEQAEKINKKRFSNIFYPCARLTYMMSYSILKIARLNSEIHTTRLKLALHIYKNRHGDFPDKLSQLTPEMIKVIPVDPINGKSFEYRREGKTFFLSCAWLKLDTERRKKRQSK